MGEAVHQSLSMASALGFEQKMCRRWSKRKSVSTASNWYPKNNFNEGKSP